MNAARKSIVVNAPVAQVYQHWLRGQDFPKFITAIKKSRRLDDSHFAVLERLNGKRRESTLEFVLRIPDRRLVWRSLSDQFVAGVVTLMPSPNGTTCVALAMMSTYGGGVSQRVGDYLQNFKTLVEGEKERQNGGVTPVPETFGPRNGTFPPGTASLKPRE